MSASAVLTFARGGAACCSASSSATATTMAFAPKTIPSGRHFAAAFSPPSASSSSLLKRRPSVVSTRAEPLGSKETVQPFDEGAAQVQRLLKRDRLELLGEGDSLEDFISASEFADDDGGKASATSAAAASSSLSAAPSSSPPVASTAAAPISPFGGAPVSPFGQAPSSSSSAASDPAASASLGGGLRGSVFGSGGAAASPFASGGLPTSQGASGLYREAERMPGEMNRGLFGAGDPTYDVEGEGDDFDRRGGAARRDGKEEKLPWYAGISLSQVVIFLSFLFTISLMLATAAFVNSVGAIRFNE